MAGADRIKKKLRRGETTRETGTCHVLSCGAHLRRNHHSTLLSLPTFLSLLPVWQWVPFLTAVPFHGPHCLSAWSFVHVKHPGPGSFIPTHSRLLFFFFNLSFHTCCCCHHYCSSSPLPDLSSHFPFLGSPPLLLLFFHRHKSSRRSNCIAVFADFSLIAGELF